MTSIERKAELCPDQAGVQPCEHCGSTGTVIETSEGKVTTIRRICCGQSPWWRSAASRDWFALFGVDVLQVAEARRHG